MLSMDLGFEDMMEYEFDFDYEDGKVMLKKCCGIDEGEWMMKWLKQSFGILKFSCLSYVKVVDDLDFVVVVWMWD